MTFHVQFTAKYYLKSMKKCKEYEQKTLPRSAIGALGAPAQSHVTLVEVNGQGVSPKKLSTEECLAQFLKPLKPAATFPAVSFSN